MILAPAWRALLQAVSRSFYLSLRFLPVPVRGELSVAYLLARAADSIADSASVSAEDRQALLAEFRLALTGQASANFFPRIAQLQVPHPGEQILLTRLGECFAQFALVAQDAQPYIRQVLGHILQGQTQDLQRFPGALPTAAVLEEYTYLVAGCVGEFWTEMLALRCPRWSTLGRAEMLRLGREYGQGLQLVNILRDLPADLATGRAYLPGDEPLLVKRDHWAAQARTWLASGQRYAAHLCGWRLRLTADLPWRLGLATLEAFPQREIQAVKVPRSTVRQLLCASAWAALHRSPRP